MTPSRGDREAGLTLIELLVTVVIMGIAFAVLVGGLGTAVVGSDYHRKQARVENVLRSFAETVKSAYKDCATKDDYTNVFKAVSKADLEGYTAEATKVEFAPPPFNAYVDTCDMQLREPNAFDQSQTTFSNPTNAYVIGEAPVPLTADASLQAGTAGTAKIVLQGYGAVPANMEATLHVVHREGAGADPPSVTVAGITTPLRPRVTLFDDKVTIPISPTDRPLGDVSYTASLASAAVTGSDSLDGIWLEFPGGSDPGLQRVSLRVTSKIRPVTQDLQVVVRRSP